MSSPSVSAQGLAVDARALDGLRRDAARDPQAAARKAAGQFEALFVQQLLKSMRDALPKGGLFAGSGHDSWVGMLDQQLSQSLADRPGGLADMIVKQLARHVQAPGAGGEDLPARAPLARERATASLDPQAAERLKTVLSRGIDDAQAAFVDRVWPHAIEAQRATGVPAAYVVGQAALESGWGRQEIRYDDGRSAHNLFGIKAGAGWRGDTVDVTTTEYVDGRPRRTVERFRAYGSYAEAFRDWASLMTGNERYAPVLRASRSVEGYASGMQRAGYATDPRYAEKLERTIQRALKLGRTTT